MPLLRRFIEAVGLRVAVVVSGLGISVLLARILGAEEFGHYVFALSVVTILSIPVQAGLPMLLTKSLPKYQIDEDVARLKGLLYFALLFTLMFSSLALFVYWVFDHWISDQVGSYAGRDAMHLAILLLPFVALSTVLGAAVRGLGRLFFGQVIETGLRQFVLLLLLCVAIFGAFVVQFSAETAMLLHIAAAVGTMVVGALFVTRSCGVSQVPGGRQIEWRTWTAVLLPLSLIAGLQVILGKSDVVMLRALVGAEEVAIYFIANQFGNLVFLANLAVRMVNGPMLSRAVQQNDLKTLQHIYSRGALFVFLSTLPAALLLLLFGELVLEVVFGVEYRNAYPAIMVFAVGYVLQALFGHTELLLKVTDNEWLVLRAMALGIVANLGLNVLMIPWFGAVGAALSSVVVTLAIKLYFCMRIRRLLGIKPFVFC